ncbi:membrane-spanning 4-domains subfamily A member 7 [Tupaia chinensis]|uniref:membrane-spanning 4-domains subfamily A member 7 n=1 Tax=Tupaia chinensis TaxID=246437 RepID=UPI0003C8F2E9|nr:membrane-spanning 4-domains subfamily A member 7 [Tupaia chinensis]
MYTTTALLCAEGTLHKSKAPFIIPTAMDLYTLYNNLPADGSQASWRRAATSYPALQTILILGCQAVSSLGAIVASAPHSSHFNPVVSTIMMFGYPFVASLCAVSSLASNAVRTVSRAGLSLLRTA